MDGHLRVLDSEIAYTKTAQECLSKKVDILDTRVDDITTKVVVLNVKLTAIKEDDNGLVIKEEKIK